MKNLEDEHIRANSQVKDHFEKIMAEKENPIRLALKGVGRAAASHLALNGHKDALQGWDAIDNEDAQVKKDHANFLRAMAESRMEASKLENQFNFEEKKLQKHYEHEERKLDEHKRHNSAMENKEKGKYGTNPETGKEFTPAEFELFNEEIDARRIKRNEESKKRIDNNKYRNKYKGAKFYQKWFMDDPDPEDEDPKNPIASVSTEYLLKGLGNVQ